MILCSAVLEEHRLVTEGQTVGHTMTSSTVPA